MTDDATERSHLVIEMTTQIVAAYASSNSIPVAELPALIATTHAALAGLGQAAAMAHAASDKPTPAQIRKSITHEALISFVDGKPYKTLKRHLTGHGLTIETYRERYGLPKVYPSTAPSYSQTRSRLAKSLGLGQKRGAAPKAAAGREAVAERPKRRGRAKKVPETV